MLKISGHAAAILPAYRPCRTGTGTPQEPARASASCTTRTCTVSTVSKTSSASGSKTQLVTAHRVGTDNVRPPLLRVCHLATVTQARSYSR